MPNSKAQTQTWVYWGLVSLVLYWGAYLRLFNLADVSFWIDEAFTIEAATSKSISDMGLQDWRSILYNSLLGVWLRVVGESELNSRLPSVFFGLCLVAACAYYAKRKGGMLAGLFITIFLSLSYWQIAWSRQAREYALLSLLVWGSMILIDRLSDSSLNNWQKLIVVLAATCLAAGVHPFGLIVPIIAILHGLWSLWPSSDSTRKGLIVLLIIVLFIAATLLTRDLFEIEGALYSVYLGFLRSAYWPLFIGIPIVVFALGQSKFNPQIPWLISIVLFGGLIVTLALPLTNLRYIQFLIPGIALIVALGIAQLKTRWVDTNILRFLIFAALLSVMLFENALLLKPQKNYALESYSVNASFVFYTPQPKFKLAYSYLNNRLPDVDLITPYPAMSRRYRSQDDLVALNVGLEYPRLKQQRLQREHYTGVYYADGPVLQQLAKQLDQIYILIDQMAMGRLDHITRWTITNQGELVRSWKKPPNSDLHLYRIPAAH